MTTLNPYLNEMEDIKEAKGEKAAQEYLSEAFSKHFGKEEGGKIFGAVNKILKADKEDKGNANQNSQQQSRPSPNMSKSGR